MKTSQMMGHIIGIQSPLSNLRQDFPNSSVGVALALNIAGTAGNSSIPNSFSALCYVQYDDERTQRRQGVRYSRGAAYRRGVWRAENGY